MSREGVFKKVGTAKLKEEEFPSNVQKLPLHLSKAILNGQFIQIQKMEKLIQNNFPKIQEVPITKKIIHFQEFMIEPRSLQLEREELFIQTFMQRVLQGGIELVPGVDQAIFKELVYKRKGQLKEMQQELELIAKNLLLKNQDDEKIQQIQINQPNSNKVEVKEPEKKSVQNNEKIKHQFLRAARFSRQIVSQTARVQTQQDQENNYEEQNDYQQELVDPEEEEKEVIDSQKYLQSEDQSNIQDVQPGEKKIISSLTTPGAQAVRQKSNKPFFPSSSQPPVYIRKPHYSIQQKSESVAENDYGSATSLESPFPNSTTTQPSKYAQPSQYNEVVPSSSIKPQAKQQTPSTVKSNQKSRRSETKISAEPKKSNRSSLLNSDSDTQNNEEQAKLEMKKEPSKSKHKKQSSSSDKLDKLVEPPQLKSISQKQSSFSENTLKVPQKSIAISVSKSEEEAENYLRSPSKHSETSKNDYPSPIIREVKEEYDEQSPLRKSKPILATETKISLGRVTQQSSLQQQQSSEIKINSTATLENKKTEKVEKKPLYQSVQLKTSVSKKIIGTEKIIGATNEQQQQKQFDQKSNQKSEDSSEAPQQRSKGFEESFLEKNELKQLEKEKLVQIAKKKVNLKVPRAKEQQSKERRTSVLKVLSDAFNIQSPEEIELEKHRILEKEQEKERERQQSMMMDKLRQEREIMQNELKNRYAIDDNLPLSEKKRRIELMIKELEQLQDQEAHYQIITYKQRQEQIQQRQKEIQEKMESKYDHLQNCYEELDNLLESKFKMKQKKDDISVIFQLLKFCNQQLHLRFSDTIKSPNLKGSGQGDDIRQHQGENPNARDQVYLTKKDPLEQEREALRKEQFKAETKLIQFFKDFVSGYGTIVEQCPMDLPQQKQIYMITKNDPNENQDSYNNSKDCLSQDSNQILDHKQTTKITKKLQSLKKVNPKRLEKIIEKSEQIKQIGQYLTSFE